MVRVTFDLDNPEQAETFRRLRELGGIRLRPDQEAKEGPCVYVIGGLRGGMIKIGQTRQLAKRMAALMTASGRSLRVLHRIPCSDLAEAKALERVLHKRFHEHRQKGEWFNLTVKKVMDALLEMSSVTHPIDRASDA